VGCSVSSLTRCPIRSLHGTWPSRKAGTRPSPVDGTPPVSPTQRLEDGLKENAFTGRDTRFVHPRSKGVGQRPRLVSAKPPSRWVPAKSPAAVPKGRGANRCAFNEKRCPYKRRAAPRVIGAVKGCRSEWKQIGFFGFETTGTRRYRSGDQPKYSISTFSPTIKIVREDFHLSRDDDSSSEVFWIDVRSAARISMDPPERYQGNEPVQRSRPERADKRSTEFHFRSTACLRPRTTGQEDNPRSEASALLGVHRFLTTVPIAQCRRQASYPTSDNAE